ncbi:hypothetical protein LC608_19280 [Nostoc sp. XA010]|uniref:hypothetical protein n=1 Tax=Nostoc sp. XA010 TaxID=2780407 RepID=UPI001E4B161E|nr:hypothetical protein [Nostoc sp. XA010]MCC5659078.1 hypothetical protein [Nostoc sp. XA010]
MESTLFTALTATEEASLSGGTDKHKKHKKYYTPVKAKPVVINQVALNVAAGILSGSTIDQTAVNVAEGITGGSTVSQTAVNVVTGTGKDKY